MKTKLLSTLALLCASLIGMSVPAQAGVYNIAVSNAGDVVSYRSWWYGGSDVGTDATANPNSVYHSYEPGNGNTANTSLSFDLASFTLPAADIVSATFNFDILSHWTTTRDDIGTFSGGGSVLYSAGLGLQSFDISTSFIDLIGNHATTANYALLYTGYSGFTFGSADGGDPAYLQIITAGDDPAAIPEPDVLLLVGSGLIGLMLAKRWPARYIV